MTKIALKKVLPLADICGLAVSKLKKINSEDGKAVIATLNYSGSVEGAQPDHKSFSKMSISVSVTDQKGKKSIKEEKWQLSFQICVLRSAKTLSTLLNRSRKKKRNIPIFTL